MSYLTNIIENHGEITAGRLKFQFKDKASVLALLSMLSDQVQEIENTFYDLLTKTELVNATGSQLDGIGEIVGIEREGLADDEYRFRIYFQIARNNSEGTAEDLINIFKILTGANQVIIQEYFPAKLSIMTGQNIPEDLRSETNQLVQDVVSAGVKIDYIGVFDEENSFAYVGSPNEGAFGYGDSTDPTVGGKYASII